jgi:hypothetical protein
MTNKPAQQKPEPAIGHNIRRARRGTAGDKAKGFVVAVSLATTLMGWGIFAREDAQTAALQAADAPPVAAVVATTSTSAGTSQSTSAVATATATAVPIVTVNAGTASDQSSSATTAASTSQSSSSTTSQVAVARTQSSR